MSKVANCPCSPPNSTGIGWGLKRRGSDPRVPRTFFTVINELHLSPEVSAALAAGHPVQLDAITSIAKTLGAPAVSETTLALVQEHFESVTVVTDADTVRAMNFILERLKVITEPAAACTLAAAEELSGNFGPTSKVVLIFCGGNTSASDLCGYQTLVS